MRHQGPARKGNEQELERQQLPAGSLYCFLFSTAMESASLQPVSSRSIVIAPGVADGMRLEIGQELTARVIAVNQQGQLLLDSKTQRFWASSEIALQPGSQLNLKVVQTSPAVYMQLVGADTAAELPPQLWELSTLFQAKDASSQFKADLDPALLLQALKGVLENQPSPAGSQLVEQLAEAMGPLSASQDLHPFFQTIRSQLENSGLFFESRLRTLLEDAGLSAESALQKLSPDLRAILGRIGQELEALPKPPENPIQTLASGLSKLQELLQAETLPANSPGQESSNPLAEQLSQLNRQADSALKEIATLATAEGKLGNESLKALQNSIAAALAAPETADNAGIQTFLPRAATSLQQLSKSLEFLQATPAFALQHLDHEIRLLAQSLAALPASTHPQLQALAGQTKALAMLLEKGQATIAENSNQQTTYLAKALSSIINHAEINSLDPASNYEADPGKILSELKTLLGQMENRAVESEPGPAPIAVREMISAMKTALGEQVLARQTEVALQWMKEGSFEVVVPVQYGQQESPAKLHFKIDREAGGKGSAGRPLTVDIRTSLPQTGKVEAWAQWHEGEINGKIYLESAQAASLFESKLPELVKSLTASGFRLVNFEVRVDPVRLYKTEAKPVEAPLPGGALFNLRV